MAMIEYIEPTSAGEMLMGLGSLIITCVLAYIFFRIYVKLAQWFDVIINREAKYEILEEAFLDRVGKAKGVDLEKELIKRRMLYKRRKSFRKKLEEEIYENMFGIEKSEKPK